MKPKDYLKHLRESHGLTQKQLGEKIKTTTFHISDYETGQRSISKSVAKQYVKYSKHPPRFLFDGILIQLKYFE